MFNRNTNTDLLLPLPTDTMTSRGLCLLDVGSIGWLNGISDDSLKGNPAMSGGRLKSKPTWSSLPPAGFDHVGFFFASSRWQGVRHRLFCSIFAKHLSR